MKQSFLSILLVGILAVGFQLSCQRDLYDLEKLSTEVEVEPQLVAPLIYGSVTMSDITELFDSIEYIGEFPDKENG
jgi:hypothetical protein